MEPTPHWSWRLSLSARFCTKGRPFSDEYNDSGDPGVIYFAFVFSCPRLLYDSECPLFLMFWLPSILFRPRASKTKLANRVLASVLYRKQAYSSFLFDPERFVSREPLSSTGNHFFGGLILQQQKCLVNLWFDRLVISESDSVLDDGILLFSVQYLTR